MAFLGLRGTGTFGADERPKDFRELILWEQPNGQAPLTALMARMGSESLSDPEFNWFQERQQLIRLKVNGAVGNLVTDTALVVAAEGVGVPVDGKSVRVGDVFMLETANGALAERVLVTANAGNGTGLTISRAFGGSTIAAIPNNSWLLRVGTAFAEGSGAASSYSTNPVKMNNLAQIFKTSYEVTNTAKLTTFRTGDPLKNEKKRKMFTHAVDMELAYLFGSKAEVIGTNGQPLRSTAGIVSQLSTNVKAYDSSPNKFQINTHVADLVKLFDYDAGGAGTERFIFCGNGYLLELQKAIEAKSNVRINFEGSIKVYGMELTKMVLPQGTFYIKTHPLFNVHPVHAYSALVFNPKGLIDRYLRKTNFEDNIQAPGSDYVKGQWLTESGPEVHFEGSHGFFTNCTYTA